LPAQSGATRSHWWSLKVVRVKTGSPKFPVLNPNSRQMGIPFVTSNVNRP
jgi:hypothetical protein